MKLYEVTDLRDGQQRRAWVNPARITYAQPTTVYGQSWETYEQAHALAFRPVKTIAAVWIGFTSNSGVIVSPEEFEVLQKAAGIEVVKVNAA